MKLSLLALLPAAALAGGAVELTKETFTSSVSGKNAFVKFKCNIQNPVDCTDKEKGYMEKVKAKSSADRQAQIDRLSKMKGETMKADLKQWLVQRLRILTALDSADQEL